VVLVAALSLSIGYGAARLQAEHRLVTSGEKNTVQVAGGALSALVQVRSRIPRHLRQPGGLRTEIGSGFFISKYLILTDDHVVALASSISVRLRGGKLVKAQLQAANPGLDLAILRVNAPAPKALRLSSSRNLLPGEKLIVLGNPYGIPNFIATGVLSAVARAGSPGAGVGGALGKLLMTTAAVLSGDSGGPVLDSSGRVVGVVDADLGAPLLVPGAQIGLAIPSSTVRGELAKLHLPRPSS
jgi:S1-C subfamily serine protease